ncbi:flavodoxin family protein [Leptolinea tardivitalis]|uniref:flavodoxin family protein n=1 Tax=Leptolinea tardivitalis TaxID=229920 RepID=UPI0007848ED4|nr:NAD(P)H-dependent oxidoreductase [Leptolinea tardivitalis]GAP20754.1 multimeric flavodoxin WrbA [Leptolinea tardivitalis]
MKILIVMGSPHKGESYWGANRLEDQLKTYPDVNVEYLWLRDLTIKDCLGCHACILKGEEKCPLKDDTSLFQQKMMEADGVIFTSPVYSMQISAQLKRIIDHLSYLWHRPRFFGKYAMALVSGGGQFKETLNYIKLNTKNWGFTYVTGLGIAHHDALLPKRQSKQEADLRKAADIFYHAVKSQKHPAPSLTDLIGFRVWRINARCLSESNPVDHAYWLGKGWFNTDYYADRPVSFVKKLAADAMEKVIHRFLQSVYQGY